jgi:SsrA-binding protein
MAKKSAENASPRIVNRKATHEFHILEKLECGIMLTGSEVKSIRNGQVSLGEGYARVEPRDMGLYLYDVDIAQYKQAGPHGHEPKRPRKLLAHKKQIEKLMGETSGKGKTLVPLAMYFVRGMVKLEIGLAVLEVVTLVMRLLARREADREIRRGMTRKMI